MLYGKKPTLLLIESEASLRRLIALGLQDQGIYVVEASEPTTIPSFDTQQLDLVVMDVDRGPRADWSFLDVLQSHSQLSTLPMIVLAWNRPSAATTSPSVIALLESPAQARAVFLPKPFDARALHGVIGQLLQARTQQEAQHEALIEERLLAAYSTYAAPSIWPVITAIGLLITVCGLLFHFAIVVLGLLVVIAALLLWTLGEKPASRNVLLR
jgi:DNA-binding response OmpR family regulator